MHEPSNICELVTVKDETAFRTFINNRPNDLLMVPEAYGAVERPVLRADAGDFAKWLRASHPEIQVGIQEADRLILRSSDFWFPLVFVASNVGLPMYLNLVSNYLYDRLKGSLRNDKPRIHLSAEYQESASGLIKRFNFEGDVDTFQKVVKKIDLNEFFHD
jgi:hypothetical protein